MEDRERLRLCLVDFVFVRLDGGVLDLLGSRCLAALLVDLKTLCRAWCASSLFLAVRDLKTPLKRLNMELVLVLSSWLDFDFELLDEELEEEDLFFFFFFFFLLLLGRLLSFFSFFSFWRFCGDLPLACSWSFSSFCFWTCVATSEIMDFRSSALFRSTFSLSISLRRETPSGVENGAGSTAAAVGWYWYGRLLGRKDRP